MRPLISTIKKIFFYAYCALFLAVSPAQAELSSSVTKSYRGPASIDQTITLVRAEAQVQSHALVLRHLAREPFMQQIKTVTSSFSPPNINGLVYAVYDFSFDYMVDPMAKTITGSVNPVPRSDNLRQAVLLALPNRTLMERYGAVLDNQKSILHTLNQLLELASPDGWDLLEHETPPPTLPQEEMLPQPCKTQDCTGQGGTCPVTPHKTETNTQRAGHATTLHTAEATETEPSTSAPTGKTTVTPPSAATVPPAQTAQRQTVQGLAGALHALQRYQTLLQHYDEKWAHPETAYAELTELEAMAPDNALIQGALAEVLLQLDKPQQAQIHSDRALVATRKYAYLYDTRGLILLRLDLPALATDAFTDALQLDIHNPLFYEHRGTSHLMRNDTPAMCQDFNKACVLGLCSGSQWAHEHHLCRDESPAEHTGEQPGGGEAVTQ